MSHKNMKEFAGWTLLIMAFVLGLAAAYASDVQERSSWPVSTEIVEVLFGVGCLLCVAVGFIWLPQGLAERTNPETSKERFEVENSAREMIAKTLGGLGVLLTLGASIQQMHQTGVTQRLAVESANTDRLYKIIDKLNASENGKPKPVDRSIALYLLDNLWRDSPQAAPTTMDALCAYVRDNAPAVTEDENGGLLSDEARDAKNAAGLKKRRMTGETVRLNQIFSMLRKRPQPDKLPPPNLQYTLLQGLDIGRSATDSDGLPPGKFSQPFFRDADFRYAILQNANLREMDLEDANFFHADLRNARLEGANLTGVNLRGAHIRGMRLSKKSGLTRQTLIAQGLRDQVEGVEWE